MDRREWVDRLFREQAKNLHRYLRGFRLPEEETYDLVQDSFVRLLEADPARIQLPKVWLFTIGRNLAINAFQRNRRRPGNSDVENLVDESPGVLTGMQEDQERAMLWQAFLKLSAKDRELMGLYLEHEFSYRQIAGILGKSEISVRVAMHRLRAQLRTLLPSMNGQSKPAQEKGNEDGSREGR